MLETEIETEVTRISLTESQQLVMLVGANETIAILPRGDGKTEFCAAPWIFDRVIHMPRSSGFIVGASYEQLLTKTIPGLVAGWEKMGIYQDVHYWINKFPKPELDIPKAYKHPEKPSHYIQWWNGTGIYLMSLDGVGMGNGVNTQWGYGDEARLLNFPRIEDDLIPTMREYANLWGHDPRFLSTLWTTDMPNDTKANYLFDARKRMNVRKVKNILGTQKEIQVLRESYEALTKTAKLKADKQIEHLNRRINSMRMGLTYYIEGKPLGNVRNLGLEWLKNQKRKLSPAEFDRAIMNKKRMKVEGGFYSLLSENKHGYFMTDYAYLEKLKFDFVTDKKRDCRWDKDIDRSRPLDISCDYNNAINSIVTGQMHKDQYRLLSAKHVLNPLLLKDCVEQWHQYYQYKQEYNKVVNYYFDNTAIGTNAASEITYADMWTHELQLRGWIVNRIYIGQAPWHPDRALLWGMLLQGEDSRLVKFCFNKSNCNDWLISCQQAKVVRKGNDDYKDKKSEKDPAIPPQHATHLSEAADILIWGVLKHKIELMEEFVDMTT